MERFSKNIYEVHNQHQARNLYNGRSSLQIDNHSLNAFCAVAEAKGNYHQRSSKRNQSSPGCPRIPPAIKLRQYQRQAVANWFACSGRGTLKMATGSGKTITALAIATELYQKIGLKSCSSSALTAISSPSGHENASTLTSNLS